MEESIDYLLIAGRFRKGGKPEVKDTIEFVLHACSSGWC